MAEPVSRRRRSSSLSEQERFWGYVLKGPAPDDCWLWTGAIADDGYGRFCDAVLERGWDAAAIHGVLSGIDPDHPTLF